MTLYFIKVSEGMYRGFDSKRQAQKFITELSNNAWKRCCKEYNFNKNDKKSKRTLTKLSKIMYQIIESKD